MSEAAQDWELKRIADCGELKLGRQRAPRYDLGINPRPYLRVVNVLDDRLDLRDVQTMDFTTAEVERYRLKPGDVLLTEGDLVSEHNVGRSAVYRGEIDDCCFTNTLIRFRPHCGCLSEYFHFAFCQLRSVGKFANATMATTVFHLSVGRITDIPVSVPPLPEQRKIARILTTVDNLIEKTEALIAKYQSVKQGLMHDLFTRGVDEHGHLRPPYAEAPDLYKESELGWIPREWDFRPLGQLSEVGGGVTLGRDLAGSQVVELPYLRVANVQDGFLDLSEIKTVAVLKSEVPRFLLQPGDMLMTEGGDFDKLGRGTVWRGQISPCLHQNHIFRVRPNTALIVSDFLAAVTASSYGKRYFLVSSKQTTNLATINSTQLKAFPVPLPDVEEQSRIISPLRAFERRLQNQQEYLAKLRTTKTALMQDLLTGKVRVKVNESGAM